MPPPCIKRVWLQPPARHRGEVARRVVRAEVGRAEPPEGAVLDPQRPDALEVGHGLARRRCRALTVRLEVDRIQLPGSDYFMSFVMFRAVIWMIPVKN